MKNMPDKSVDQHHQLRIADEIKKKLMNEYNNYIKEIWTKEIKENLTTPQYTDAEKKMIALKYQQIEKIDGIISSISRSSFFCRDSSFSERPPQHALAAKPNNHPPHNRPVVKYPSKHCRSGSS